MAEVRGYIEGYYGKLLTWDERSRLLKQMQRLGMTGYLYAPKEDACTGNGVSLIMLSGQVVLPPLLKPPPRLTSTLLPVSRRV